MDSATIAISSWDCHTTFRQHRGAHVAGIPLAMYPTFPAQLQSFSAWLPGLKDMWLETLGFSPPVMQPQGCSGSAPCDERGLLRRPRLLHVMTAEGFLLSF
jgi:hypothetical protein